MKVFMLSGDPRTVIPGNETYRRMQEYVEAIGELKILALSGRNAIRRLFDLWLLWKHGKKLLKEAHYDVITVQAADDVGLVGYALSRRFGVPLQIQVHTDIFSPWYRRAGWREYIRYWLARVLIPRADCIRVVSERIGKSAAIMIGSRTSYHGEVRLPNITVLPIFTEVSKFLEVKPDVATEARFRGYDFKMIAVGRFVDKEKNFSMLIEMMRDFVKVCPRALLVLVGDGPSRRNYELRIRNYGLEKHVILEAWRNDLFSFYKSFDLYLMPSNYEGWGRTVIEAMASGLPIVMTDVGLAGEVVKDKENGRIVPIGDTKIFLEVVKGFYENPAERSRLAEAGRRTVVNLEPRSKIEYLERYKRSIDSCIS